MPSPISQRKRIGFALVAILVPLTLLLLATEAILTIRFPIHSADMSGAYQYDEELGVRVKPNLHWTDTTDHYRELRTNAKGTVNLQESFADYRRLVFAVGDSYTEGIGVGLDSSYPFQLDMQLNLGTNGYQKEYGVVNLGLAGYGLQQATLTARRYAAEIGKPAFILYLAAHNDPIDDRRFSNGDSHRYHVDGNPNVGLSPGLIRIVSSTQLGKRLRRALSPSRRRRGRMNKELAQTRKDAPKPPGWSELQEAHLTKLKEAAADLDAALIIGFAGWGDDYESLRDWAKREGVTFADWQTQSESMIEAFPALPRHNSHSGGHLRPWVYRLIAESMADQIRRHTKQIDDAR